jgi:hypothetical protein
VVQYLEDLMSELEMKNEAETETEDFSDELSDEALDREGAGTLYCRCCDPSEPERSGVGIAGGGHLLRATVVPVTDR